MFGIRVFGDTRVGLLMSVEAAIPKTNASVEFQELEHMLREPKSILFRVDHTVAGGDGKDNLVPTASAKPADAVFTCLPMFDMKADMKLELSTPKGVPSGRKPSTR